MTSSRLAAVALSLLVGGCAALPRLGGPPPAPPVLHPQANPAAGVVLLHARNGREPIPVGEPLLLEMGDVVETSPDGKAEVLLPQAVIRLYGDTRVQVAFTFEERRAVARELRVERGEVLVRRLGNSPFQLQTPGLQVDAFPGSTFLVGSREALHTVTCFEGAGEARNVRIRGQTVVSVLRGQHFTLDDGANLAYLRDRRLPDEWRRWERAGVYSPEAPTPSP